MAHIIHFEDRGQDFLRWTVRDGEVVESSGQDWMWKGTKVLNTPKVGEKLRIKSSVFKDEETTLRYRVTKIEEVPDMVECVECGAEMVDPGVGVRCEADSADGERCNGRLERKAP